MTIGKEAKMGFGSLFLDKTFIFGYNSPCVVVTEI